MDYDHKKKGRRNYETAAVASVTYTHKYLVSSTIINHGKKYVYKLIIITYMLYPYIGRCTLKFVNPYPFASQRSLRGPNGVYYC